MAISSIKQQINIPNSPIEFIIVGPARGRDAILVRSSNAGLDLIGLANSKYDFSETLRIGNSFSALFSSYRQLNIVKSRNSIDLEPTIDGRRSNYRFAWIGYATNSDKRRIEELFAGSMNVIRQALIRENDSDVELVVSSLILECSITNQKRLKAKKIALAVSLIYILLFFSFLLLKNVLPSLFKF